MTNSKTSGNSFLKPLRCQSRKNFLARFVSLSFWDLMVVALGSSPSLGDQSGDGLAGHLNDRKESR